MSIEISEINTSSCDNLVNNCLSVFISLKKKKTLSLSIEHKTLIWNVCLTFLLTHFRHKVHELISQKGNIVTTNKFLEMLTVEAHLT